MIMTYTSIRQVGPVTDLSLHPTHRIDILDLATHSCEHKAGACSADSPCCSKDGSVWARRGAVMRP